MRTPTEPDTRKRRYAKRLPAEARREQLLDAALRVLARQGYRDLTVEAIAREAGVTRPVVYATYDGLEPLLNALLDRTQQRALESVIGVLPAEDDHSDVRGWLLAGIVGVLDEVQRQPEVWRPVLGIIENAPGVVRDRIDRTKEGLRLTIAGTLERGLDAQGLPGQDTDVLSHLIMATGEHLARLVIEDPATYSRDRLVTTIERLLTPPV